jgi:hypothetical protein
MSIFSWNNELYCEECAFIIECQCLLDRDESDLGDIQYPVKVKIESTDWPEHCSSKELCTTAIDLGYEKIGCLLDLPLNSAGYALIGLSNSTPLTDLWKKHYLGVEKL